VWPSAPQDLTAAERRVAELAAGGLTNQQVAAAAFLSRKTVEANLTRIYRKLGIRYRAELGVRLVERDGVPGGQTRDRRTPQRVWSFLDVTHTWILRMYPYFSFFGELPVVPCDTSVIRATGRPSRTARPSLARW
jgi:DNA-binding CsgD family transcriptional regulator